MLPDYEYFCIILMLIHVLYVSPFFMICRPIVVGVMGQFPEINYDLILMW